MALAAQKKRPSSSGSGRASKRIALPGLGDTVSKQCQGVRKAIQSVDGLSDSYKGMLTCKLEKCLGISKEDRHEFQVRVVNWIGEVLQQGQADLTAAVNAAQTKASEEEAQQKSLADRETELEEDAKGKTEATAAAKTAMAEASSALAAAKKELAGAENDRKNFDAQYSVKASKKEKLEEVLNTSFTGLKDGTVDPGDVAKHSSQLLEYGEKFGLDPSLLSSLPKAMAKTPDARGGFDNMCFDQVEEELKKQIKLLTDELANGDTTKAENEQKSFELKKNVEEKEQADQSSKDAFKAAQEAQDDARTAAKAAAKQAKNYHAVVKHAAGLLADAKEKLRSFSEGALADYGALKNNQIIDGRVYDEVLLTAVGVDASSGGQVSYAEARRLELWSDKRDGPISRLEKATMAYAMRKYTFTDKAKNFLAVNLNSGERTSYYEIIDGKKYDRALLEEARKFAADGQISLKEAKKLFEDAKDGSTFTGTERGTLEHALETLTWTDVARAYMKRQLSRDKPTSYYKIIDKKQYDAELLRELEDYAQSNGSVSEEEAQRLWESACDGPGVTAIERKTLKYGLQNFEFTEAARAFLVSKV